MSFEIKKCGKDDIGLLYKLMGELIEYHGMTDSFTFTEKRLEELVMSGILHGYIAYKDGDAAGHIIFFYKYTTFTGRKILYLEDIYTREKFRGLGLGARFFELMRQIAKDNDCERIEWKCADFNESGKRFYKKIGAEPEDTWITYTIERSDF